MDISIVVPAYNEDESLPALLEEIKPVVDGEGYSWELIIIDDGSTDDTWKVTQQLSEQYPQVRGIKFGRNYGKSAALYVGFEATEGDIVLTMDADLQDRPKHIPEFVRMIREEGFDLVSGWKQKRKDPFMKTFPTKIYNGVNRRISGIKLHDMNCGFKAYRKEVVKNIEVYGEMHRYIPVIAKAAGFKKIGELRVEHIARKFGKTKFGMDRFINGFLDMLSINFMTRYMRSPMHFFGLWGVIWGGIGGITLFTLYFMKILGMTGIIEDFYIGTHIPILFFGMIAFLFGGMLLFTGLMAELIGRNSPLRNDYKIAARIRVDKDSAASESRG